jgi:hypothetical protein
MGTKSERWRRIVTAEQELRAALKEFSGDVDDFEDISDEDLVEARNRLGSLTDELRRISESLDAEKQRRGLADHNAASARPGL